MYALCFYSYFGTGTSVSQCVQLHLHCHLCERVDDQGNINSTGFFSDLTHEEELLLLG